MTENEISRIIVDAAIEVHRELEAWRLRGFALICRRCSTQRLGAASRNHHGIRAFCCQAAVQEIFARFIDFWKLHCDVHRFN
jgi:hypothetical protein